MALTDAFVRQVKATGKPAGDKYADGGAMYLLVKGASKYWRMDYAHSGKRKTLALGVYPAVSLLKARQRRDKAREQLADGIDPNSAKRQEKQALIEEANNTFEVVARQWLATTASRRKEVTQKKTTSWLDRDVFPVIGKMPISSVSAKDVLEKVARRMEARGVNESTHRVVQLCSQIFRFAVASGLTDRDVTSALRGALKPVITTHYAAITKPEEVGRLLRSIDGYQGHATTIAALKLSALLMLRPGELRAVEWSEVQLNKAEWHIPASRMKKTKMDHVVPLSRQAVQLLNNLHPVSGHSRFVFPNVRTPDRCMSNNTICAALRNMGYDKEAMSAHGFRATSRTIMDEVLLERPDLLEHQLAHKVNDANGRAYNRTAHLPGRHEMMQRWADYLDQLRATEAFQHREDQIAPA